MVTLRIISEKKDIWRWNKKVNETIKENRRCYKVHSKLKKQKPYDKADKNTEVAYKAAKKHTKQTVWQAKQDADKVQFVNVNPNGPKIHHMAKQMCRKNRDVCGEMPVLNNQGKFYLEESKKMKAWVEHYKSLLNGEYLWDEDALPDALPV